MWIPRIAGIMAVALAAGAMRAMVQYMRPLAPHRGQ